MKKIITLLIFVLFFMSCAEKVEDWELVTENSSGSKLYIDKESIKHNSENNIRAWFKVVFDKPELSSNDKYTMYMLGHEQHDCSEHKSKLLQLTYYYEDGDVEDIYIQPKWSYIKPESIQADKHEYLCKNGK